MIEYDRAEVSFERNLMQSGNNVKSAPNAFPDSGIFCEPECMTVPLIERFSLAQEAQVVHLWLDRNEFMIWESQFDPLKNRAIRAVIELIRIVRQMFW